MDTTSALFKAFIRDEISEIKKYIEQNGGANNNQERQKLACEWIRNHSHIFRKNWSHLRDSSR